MIDEKKLIEHFKKLKGADSLANMFIKDVIKEIEKQPKIDKWIPCSERLPEVFDNVLVCTKEGGRAIAHRCPNQIYGRYYDLHSSPIDNVTAWQPLPEPYKPSLKPSTRVKERDNKYGKACQSRTLLL